MDKKASEKIVAIDLTADSEKEEAIVVDLTSPVGNKPRKRKRKRASNSSDGAVVVMSSEAEDSDVILLSPDPHRPRLPPPLNPSQAPLPPSPVPQPHQTPSSSTYESPGSQGISCPICMDSKRQFTESGRTLVATKCGHLFCDACIRESIKLNHKCPTCSTKLTLKQYHRIYL